MMVMGTMVKTTLLENEAALKTAARRARATNTAGRAPRNKCLTKQSFMKQLLTKECLAGRCFKATEVSGS